MQITVTFDSIEEMKDFTEKIFVGGALREQRGAAEEVKTAEATAVSVVQTTPPAAMPPVPPVAPVAGQPAPSAAASVPTASVPTSAVTYTPDDLARAAMSLMDSGKQQELIGLLGQFGVVAIPELRPEQYGGFATALRGLGAQI